MSPFSRRTLLQGAAGATLAHTLFRHSQAFAAGTLAKNLVVWFTPCGTAEEHFRPTATATGFDLSMVLAPLAPFKDKLLLFGPQTPDTTPDKRQHVGISMKCRAGNDPSQGHGLAKILTGRIPLTVGEDSYASGISVDQHLANRIGLGTPFKSVQLGIRTDGASPTSGITRLCYSGSGAPVSTESNPLTAFNTLFSSTPSADPTAERRRQLRKSVLDGSRAQFEALKAHQRLGKEAREKLERNLTAINEVEKQLVAAETACTPPTPGNYNSQEVATSVSYGNWTNVPTVGKFQMDNLHAALSCGLTRVATLMWGYSHSHIDHGGWLPDAGGQHHDPISHATDPDSRLKLAKIHRWYMQQLAYFMDQLQNTPDGNGTTLLDNTLILVVNELSHPGFHTHQNMPFFIAGGAGGAIQMGKYLQFADRPHNDLLLAVCHAFGVMDASFGDPQFHSNQPVLPILT